MQRAKEAAEQFLSKKGKHDTTVEQEIRPSATEEHVRPHNHEVVTTALDKEVHQDHYQTRIQPVTATETRPEKHSHMVIPVQHTTHEHGNEGDVRSKIGQDVASFQDTSTKHETTHSAETAPVVSGERIHHHVKEHIQPVIHKDVIEPHVVHKVVPIHQTHHAEPIFHEKTTLPTKTLEEFTQGGGSLAGVKSGSTTREFEGCPGPYDKDRQLPGTALHTDVSQMRGQEDMVGSRRADDVSQAGERSDLLETNRSGDVSHIGERKDMVGSSHPSDVSRVNGQRDMALPSRHGDLSRQEISSSQNGSGLRDGSGSKRLSDSSSEGNNYTVGDRSAESGTAGVTGASVVPKTHNTTTDAAKPRSNVPAADSATASHPHAKPSLLDRLNPIKDADGDGKKGFMS